MAIQKGSIKIRRGIVNLSFYRRNGNHKLGNIQVSAKRVLPRTRVMWGHGRIMQNLVALAVQLRCMGLTPTRLIFFAC